MSRTPLLTLVLVAFAGCSTRPQAPQRYSYMYTIDLSAGAGSYSGPYTRFAEPTGDGFGWLMADSAGVLDTLTMVSTLKTAWEAVRHRSDPNAELLMVRCRPNLSVPADSVAFTLTFERFTFDGMRWRLRARSEPGCYESDEPFPPESKFPWRFTERRCGRASAPRG